MSEIQSVEPAAEAKAAAERIIAIPSDVSLMTLDAGLYCVVVSPSPAADAVSGLPGVRITAAPGTAGRPQAVTVRTVAEDGWLSGFGDAALVRVVGGQAQVLISIYHRPGAGVAGAPNLQVLPLLSTQGAPSPALLGANQPRANLAPDGTAPRGPIPVDVLAHIQKRGDVGVRFGEWLGLRGSGAWIEGFAIGPVKDIALADVEYQAVLGRGWLSPWVEGGQFCGSRGMALPILGLRVRLRGEAAKNFEIRVSATFVDGSTAGPVAGGESCEAASLAAVEAILIEVIPLAATAAAPEAPSKKKAPRTKPGKPDAAAS